MKRGAADGDGPGYGNVGDPEKFVEDLRAMYEAEAFLASNATPEIQETSNRISVAARVEGVKEKIQGVFRRP